MPTSASAGRKLYAIWRYSNYQWTHVGYTYSLDDAKKVCDGWNKGIGTHNYFYDYNSSKYTSPSRWDKKWIAVFYKYGTSEWGRFLYGFNFEIVNGLRRYYRDWENQNNLPVATTKGVYINDVPVSDNQFSTMHSSMNCADSGKYASSSGGSVRCV